MWGLMLCRTHRAEPALSCRRRNVWCIWSLRRTGEGMSADALLHRLHLESSSLDIKGCEMLPFPSLCFGEETSLSRWCDGVHISHSWIDRLSSLSVQKTKSKLLFEMSRLKTKEYLFGNVVHHRSRHPFVHFCLLPAVCDIHNLTDGHVLCFQVLLNGVVALTLAVDSNLPTAKGQQSL